MQESLWDARVVSITKKGFAFSAFFVNIKKKTLKLIWDESKQFVEALICLEFL